MTRVDFYILPTDAPGARLDFACRLAEKAWRQGMKVHLHCADVAQRDALDERLWSVRPASFLPHGLASDAPDDPLTLGCEEELGAHRELLINLGIGRAPRFAEFARLAEIVIEEPAIRQAAREAFRYYREQGYPLQDHRLSRL